MMRRRSLLAISAAVALAAGGLALAIPANADTNVLTNGGFETGNLSGWSCDSTASVVTGQARTGTYAVKGGADNSSTAKCRQTVNVVANTAYSLSGYVKGSYVYLGVESGSSTWTPGTGGAYQKLSVSFTTGVSQTSVTVYTHGWYGQGAYYADDLALIGPGGTTPSPSTSPTTSPSATTSPSPTASPSPGGTPVAINGQLRVCGVQLCNKHNKAIQLRGMSTHGLQWYRSCVNNASLDALANDWKADVIRLSTYVQEGGYETDPAFYTNLVHDLIEKASARGIYAIVDWHMLDPGDPHYNLDRAKTFFTEIAQRHGNKPNLLYEVANEPNGVNWARIKSYHEQIIPVIRGKDSDAVILLGTPAWSSLGVSDGGNESEVVNNPVNASNVLYTFHFYAASHGSEYLNALSRAADRIPMFVTEFGTQEYTGDGPNDFNRSQQYIDLMATKKISWVNWNYSDDHRSGAVFIGGTCPNGTFAGTSRLKPAGVWVRDRIRTTDNFPTS